MGEAITFAANGSTASGYLTGSAGPGVVVIQEWWGLNDQIRRTADMVVAQGFRCLAPDLYDGRVTEEPDEAAKLAMALDAGRVAAVVGGAARHLAGITGGRVGAIGFCMGGSIALVTATIAPEAVGAVVDCYGGFVRSSPPDFSATDAAVLGIFAGRDDHIDAGVVASLGEALRAGGVEHSFHTYPEADHGFLNDERKEFRPEDAADVWRRVVSFFRGRLA